MTPLQQKIVSLNAEHPDWTDKQIAMEAVCSADFVRSYASRQCLRLGSRRALWPPKPPKPPKRERRAGIVSLGNAARAAGMTLADIEQWAADRCCDANEGRLT